MIKLDRSCAKKTEANKKKTKNKQANKKKQTSKQTKTKKQTKKNKQKRGHFVLKKRNTCLWLRFESYFVRAKGAKLDSLASEFPQQKWNISPHLKIRYTMKIITN